MTTRKKQSGTDVSAPSGLESRIEMLFETSWEVCNKVGGIYAVLSTKAKVLGQKFGDKLVFIGPDIWTEETPSPHFKERKTMFRSAAVKLDLPWGIRVRTGRWDIPGAPQVILVDPGETVRHLPGIYGDMWVNFGVDSLHSYGDYDESCAFAVASAIVIGALTSYMRVSPGHVVAHFDEWTTGMGLLYLKLIQPKTSTVFTTHATSIGRSICGNGKPLYDYFTNYNGDQMARELNMESKHSLEKAAAHEADCFTTVSEVTARECAQLLGIRPQVVTPNGFEPGFVPKTVRYNRLRREGRQTLLRVASLLDGNEYDDSTFLLATSGRHEYRNKGLDLFLDCVAALDARIPQGLKTLAFILVPGWTRCPSAQLEAALRDGDSTQTGKISPAFLTHRLNNEDSDEVCVRIRQLQAEGRLDRVKVIYVPSYLDGSDGIVNISYYDLLPAFDLTLFPSYYEPWGYTPLESVAFGVPTVTDDKAGFGQWVLDNFENGIDRCGVSVEARTDSNYIDARNRIVADAVAYEAEDSNGRMHARNMAFLTAAKADWKFFIENYFRAFEIAMDRNARK